MAVSPALFYRGAAATSSSTLYTVPSSTTSILNTPFFVNAILEGVNKQRGKEKFPYVAAAYLFINSLPLATLRERYKSNFGEKYNLDYIATCFNKFGALHKVPFAWILKIGSLWQIGRAHV